MKRIFLVFLIVPILTFSQDKEIDELRNDLNIVKENLDTHHKQFLNGALISIIGIAATITGSITLTPVLSIGGGVVYLIGAGIMIDSDKWFGRKYIGNVGFQPLTEYFYEGVSFTVGEKIIYDKTQEAMIWDILMYKNGTTLVEIKLKNGEKLRVAFTDIKKQ
jgi:hypothetical protein